MNDLMLKGGRILDPGRAFDSQADILLSNRKVAAVGSHMEPRAGTTVIDVAGKYVVPGLIDMHTHVYWGGTSHGVEVEPLASRSGTTTFVDAGSAGASNFHGFRRHVIEPSRLRILAYLNVSFPGIFALSSTVMVGECAQIELLSLPDCVEVANANRDLIVGIKVRVGAVASGQSGIAPLDMAIEAAEALEMPVMVHIEAAPPSRREIAERLRPGDVLTHCFRSFPNALITQSRAVQPEVRAARERGVIFDIGHGKGSFAFDTARGMLEAGFLPDVISSDIHSRNIDGPVYDLLSVMSKFYCLGMPFPEIIRATTAAPASAIRRPELGTLREGGIADAAILDIAEGDFSYVDSVSETLRGKSRLVLRGLIVGGEWLEPMPPLDGQDR